MTCTLGSECTKIARFSAAAAAIFTAPQKNRDFLRPQDARFPLRRKSLANRDFFCEEHGLKIVLAAEFLAIPSSAVKIASERRCAILVHSVSNSPPGTGEKNGHRTLRNGFEVNGVALLTEQSSDVNRKVATYGHCWFLMGCGEKMQGRVCPNCKGA